MSQKRIIFALGSNLGNRQSFLKKAIDKLIFCLDLVNVKESAILENKALLLPNSPLGWDKDFYNLVISADIDIDYFSAEVILDIIKKIETQLGRIDRGRQGRWSPREIDIDILAISDLFINLGSKLQIPHKELLNRSFFINPFIEIEPNLFKIIKNKILGKN